MYCLFYKDHSSVYVQCAAANGTTNPAGADAGLRVQEASRPKLCKLAQWHKTSQLHVVLGCEYILYLLRLNDYVLNRIEFLVVYKLFDFISLVIHRRYQL